MNDSDHQNSADPLRLQKYLARAGVASRRASEELIKAGRVSINGMAETQMGIKVNPLTDEVAVNGNIVHLIKDSFTLMLHKPAGYLSTMADPQGRPTVSSLVPTERYPSLFPIGRLDKETTGLLLFSTDGSLGNELLRPRGHVVKRYLALVSGLPSCSGLASFREGMLLQDGPTLPAEAELMTVPMALKMLPLFEVAEKLYPHALSSHSYANALQEGEISLVSIGLHEGRKRQVRRMFAKLGHPVLSLHRISFGPVQLGNLARGSWRILTPQEVGALKRACKSHSE